LPVLLLCDVAPTTTVSTRLSTPTVIAHHSFFFLKKTIAKSDIFVVVVVAPADDEPLATSPHQSRSMTHIYDSVADIESDAADSSIYAGFGAAQSQYQAADSPLDL
jgi:hypothetical protein